MVERQGVSSGARWEPLHGYSRAVRVGSSIFVSGTVGIFPDGTAPPDMYSQSRRSLEIITTALAELGAGPEHVVRTRVFTTDVTQFEEIARAHREVFGEIRPASTMVEVSRLLDDSFLVEIEAEALIPEGSHD